MDGIILDAVRSKAKCFSKLHYFYVKREDNMVAYILTHFTLNVSDYSMWMKNISPQFHSFVLTYSNNIH